MMLVALALAQEAVEVPAGETRPVEGPAVVLSPARFRRYVSDSRYLATCEEDRDRAMSVAEDVRARWLACVAVGTEALDEGDAARAEHLELVADLGRRLERAERRGRIAGVVGVAVGVGLTLGAAWGWGQVADNR